MADGILGSPPHLLCSRSGHTAGDVETALTQPALPAEQRHWQIQLSAHLLCGLHGSG